MQWYELKNWMELSTGLDRDSLHIYAGVGVQLTAALFCRRSLASLIPWLCVAAVALGNEYSDYIFIAEVLVEKQIYYDEAIRDIWNTLLLPSTLLLIAKFWPHWLTGKVDINRNSDASEEGKPSG
ncbi:hypothetical protein [uncultured Parasphingorhabdus sp.]|uniref:hypothetical protein n=1 Tax=uncultured Parasphingorhabdus sp. TaxID=2709694 RepID=UPI0030DD5171|tara:strand:+ start:22384 stop:22758 length:375 start_codon:yes stop_codon:yes gene_type:complete